MPNSDSYARYPYDIPTNGSWKLILWLPEKSSQLRIYVLPYVLDLNVRLYNSLYLGIDFLSFFVEDTKF